MNEQLLSCRQLFNLKPKTLETRITNFYNQTQNSSLTIQYILTLRVRYQLGAQEFAHILKDLVRYLFMNTKATRTMKRFFYYFQDYFMAPEWRSLRLRLFTVRSFGEKVMSIARSLVSAVRPDETNEP
ncbi:MULTISPECIES: hypothetical protein [Enterococcus]|uniref:Uncharacterized protein n=1 Tax=Enterococcus malodoratus ATCC 43197 TaxID=1158601 RepID=R2P0G6_9ENTE|nr:MULTISPECIES: hypothetical protein [Enterococcus]BBM16626.1 hypothetical protein G15_0239 [Enterococcus avium]EOH76758.1 hypothetical protein UAI_02433 [Enterococcus malodoratus ATCC 43197]EOT63541.1 hypothetical protein I585_04371 [Enterococcus malodoratus ATCC 43197]OJG64962.1 hypothetical protein RV07_GL003416 [Enterococcus malodoratus]SET27182.1 hypothetical protein SAMN04487821_1097 [Enterococcus malodoratus]